MTLDSTLNAEHVAYPQEVIIFTCTTRGSPILEWFSEEYIGTGGDRLQILSGSDRNISSSSHDVVATRISVTEEDGATVIVSELRIITSIKYPTATVSCSNGDQRFMQSITFRTFGKKIESIVLSILISHMYSNLTGKSSDLKPEGKRYNIIWG